MKSNGVNKAVIIISKIIEVFCWVGAALSVALTALTVLGQQWLYQFLTSANAGDSSIAIHGFEISSGSAGVALTPTAFAFAFVTSAIVCVLAAMISRNVYLIFKTSVGETWFSKGSTPFQPDNIRMVREIGIFAIAVPVVELIVSVIAAVVVGPDCVETSVNMTGVFFGLVALALSQYFSYGAELQSEVDGLV